MRLHKDKKVFKELILATTQNTPGLQTYQVEKDYFVSLFLKELSVVDFDYEIVFKGGTSLSKCYGVIDRFSEDIDLAINFKNQNASRRVRRRLKNKIVTAIDNLDMIFINQDQVESNRDFNNYEIEYEKTFDATSEMLPFIKVETIAVYKPYPIEKLEVGNYITKYLESIEEGIELIDKYDLQRFKMNVQAIERTFIDKLFAICDYHLVGTYDRYSRHIYDIHMIWKSKLLNIEKINTIIDDVIKDRQRFTDRNLSSNPGTKVKEILSEIITKEVFKKDFNDVSTIFIYNDVSYESIIKSLSEIIKTDILPDFIKTY